MQHDDEKEFALNDFCNDVTTQKEHPVLETCTKNLDRVNLERSFNEECKDKKECFFNLADFIMRFRIPNCISEETKIFV